jgi:hypothetical protein
MTIKLLIPTLLFYAIALTIVYLLDKISPTGPCTPGLGIISFMCLIPISIVLVIRNIYLAVKIDKSNFIVAIMHIVVMTIALIFG